MGGDARAVFSPHLCDHPDRDFLLELLSDIDNGDALSARFVILSRFVRAGVGALAPVPLPTSEPVSTFL